MHLSRKTERFQMANHLSRPGDFARHTAGEHTSLKRVVFTLLNPRVLCDCSDAPQAGFQNPGRDLRDFAKSCASELNSQNDGTM